MLKHIAGFILLFYTIVAAAGTIDPNTSDDKYIKYAHDFHYIGRLCGKSQDDKAYCASAVAIGPRWIVTAAHVVKDIASCKFKIKDKEFCIVKIVCHKDYNHNIFGHADIAVGYSDEDFGLDFYPDLYTDRDEVGKLCSISGYGITGTFLTGAIKSDGHKRAGSNLIEGIDRKLLICKPSYSREKTSLEFLIASGDSGGGLFIGNKLAGINSCVIASDKKPDSTYGDESGHTRISEYASWIKEQTTMESK